METYFPVLCFHLVLTLLQCPSNYSWLIMQISFQERAHGSRLLSETRDTNTKKVLHSVNPLQEERTPCLGRVHLSIRVPED